MDDWGKFLIGMIGSRPIEVTATILGLCNIILLLRRSIWNYPFGIAMVSLYFYIFYGAKLYSDMLLQPFFFVAQIYGWYYWLNRRDDAGLVIVSRLGAAAALAYGAAAIVFIALLGTLMGRYTDAAFPYWDASIAVLSVIAQILLARRRLENWLVWVLVDALAVSLYWTKGLYPTAALYSIFFVLAVMGYVTWRKAWTRGVEVS